MTQQEKIEDILNKDELYIYNKGLSHATNMILIELEGLLSVKVATKKIDELTKTMIVDGIREFAGKKEYII